MKSFLPKRVLSPSLFFLAVGALIHCGGNDDDTSFTSRGDAAVMSGIVGIWMGTSDSGNTYTLTLCEDTTAPASKTSCQTLHRVQGQGRGKTETVSQPEGCGGCDYDNSAYVRGTIEGDDLASMDIAGQFALTGGDTNSLGFPYQARLDGTAASYDGLTIYGQVPSAGEFDVDDFSYPKSNVPPVDASSDADADASSDADASNDADASTSNSAGPVLNATTFHRVGDATCP